MPIPRYNPLLVFFLLAFGITWGLGALTLMFSAWLPTSLREFGPGNPIFNLAVYAPAISALVVIGQLEGKAGLNAFLRRLLYWNTGLRWYLLVLLGIPALQACTRLLSHVLQDTPLAYPITPWYAVIPAALWTMVYLPGPVEEIGWRGFALPQLQARYGALTASLLLGLVWALWHLPAFFVVEFYQQGMSVFASFVPFLIAVCAISVLMTVVYNGTEGCMPLAILAHWLFNDPLQLSNHPADATVDAALLMLVATAAVAITRKPRYPRLLTSGFMCLRAPARRNGHAVTVQAVERSQPEVVDA
jgi:membrane protease YdiL (CAAX protease family)